MIAAYLGIFASKGFLILEERRGSDTLDSEDDIKAAKAIVSPSCKLAAKLEFRPSSGHSLRIF